MNNDQQFTVISRNLSFIEKVLPELKGQIINLIQPTNNGEKNDEISYSYPINELNDTDNQLEITGNPLEYNTFTEENFNLTLKPCKQFWKKQDEAFTVFDKKTASCLLSLNLQKQYNEEKKVPTFVICDYQNESNTIVLGSFIDENNLFTTIKIDDGGFIGISQMDQQLISDLNQFADSKSTDKIEIMSSSEYEVFGTKSDYIGSNDKLKENFAGSLSIYSKWNSATFKPCQKSSENTLIMETIVNEKESLLKDLWNQQLLLIKYLDILENYAANTETSFSSKYIHNSVRLNFPADFSSPYYQENYELKQNYDKLKQKFDDLWLQKYYQVISGANTTIDMVSSNETVQGQNKLSRILKKLGQRSNLDLTDNLWTILRGFDNYKHIMDTIYKTLDENCHPSINTTNSTLFAKLLQTTNKSHLKFSMQQPLEYLVDMGIQKLVADYMYLFRVTNLIDSQEIKNKLNVSKEEFNISHCKNKLLIMAQINICLEFALLAETHLDFSKEHLRRLLNLAFEKYCRENSPVISLKELNRFCIYNLSISVPVESIKNELIRTPLLYKSEFQIKNHYSSRRAIKVYSMNSIFPPKICPEKEINYDDENYSEGIFKVVKCSTSGLRVPYLQIK